MHVGEGLILVTSTRTFLYFLILYVQDEICMELGTFLTLKLEFILLLLFRENKTLDVSIKSVRIRIGFGRRRRIKTEEKEKVVASVWGKELIQFFAALANLPRTILKNRMNSSFSFKSSLCNSSYNSNRPVQNS